MLRIITMSDTHGQLPKLDLHNIDMVLHAGDWSCSGKYNYTSQEKYFLKEFCPWIRNIAGKIPHVYYINGNHETWCEKYNINSDYNDVTKNHCINDCNVLICLPYNKKINLYGFPWTPTFYNWAYNLDDNECQLGEKCKDIPADTNILLSHGPVYGINDIIEDERGYFYGGSKELLKRVLKIKPKLFISGHLHDDKNYEIVDYQGIKFVGCSIMNEYYENARQPIIVTLEI